MNNISDELAHAFTAAGMVVPESKLPSPQPQQVLKGHTNMYQPQEGIDGVDFINISMKTDNPENSGFTLGKWLAPGFIDHKTNGVYTPLGTMPSLEVYGKWLCTEGMPEKHLTQKRPTNLNAELRNYRRATVPNYWSLLTEAFWYRLQGNPEMATALRDSELPFTAYHPQPKESNIHDVFGGVREAAETRKFHLSLSKYVGVVTETRKVLKKRYPATVQQAAMKELIIASMDAPTTCRWYGVVANNVPSELLHSKAPSLQEAYDEVVHLINKQTPSPEDTSQPARKKEVPLEVPKYIAGWAPVTPNYPKRKRQELRETTMTHIIPSFLNAVLENDIQKEIWDHLGQNNFANREFWEVAEHIAMSATAMAGAGQTPNYQDIVVDWVSNNGSVYHALVSDLLGSENLIRYDQQTGVPTDGRENQIRILIWKNLSTPEAQLECLGSEYRANKSLEVFRAQRWSNDYLAAVVQLANSWLAQQPDEDITEVVSVFLNLVLSRALWDQNQDDGDYFQQHSDVKALNSVLDRFDTPPLDYAALD